MEAIRALQKQLQAAQQQSNIKKISERNCVDLVQKLIAEDRVKLIHSSTGKEWLTPEQLERELREALAAAGGRVGVTDLPNEVGIAIEHIENRVDHMCKKDSSITRLQGELLSSDYVQGVAQEMSEILEQSGSLALSELAGRYNLPAEFIRTTVFGKLGSNHTVKQNMIYTSAYASRMESRARGALRGCTVPVTLAQLAANHKLDTDVLATAAQKMLKDGRVVGKMQGSTFTPKVYSASQGNKVEEFFSANQYIPLQVAKDSEVNLKEWTKEKKVDGVTLSTVWAATIILDPVLASITEAMKSKSWVDVQPLLPPSFVIADACELLQHFGTKKKLPANTVPLGSVAVSKEFIKSLADGLEKEVKKAAEKALTAPAAAKKKAAPAAFDDDDDGGGKKKGKKGAKSKKKGGDDDDDEGGGGDGGGASSGIDNQVIVDMLNDKHSDIPADVHDELCGQLQPVLTTQVAAALDALRSSLQSKSKAQFEGIEKFVQERYEKLVLGFRTLESMAMGPDSPLYTYLLKEVVTEPLHRLLAVRWEEVSGKAEEVTASNRKQILDKIVTKEGAAKAESLTRLVAVFDKDKGGKKEEKEVKVDKKSGKDKGDKGDKGDKESKDVGDITDIFHAAADDCHIFCRKVDKKREKSALPEYRAARKELLKDAAVSDAMQVFTHGLHLALIQDKGVAGFVFPSEVWAFKLLMEQLSDEEVQKRAVDLCTLIDKGGDAVALESKTDAWKTHWLDSK
eukprot:gnl/TRDRNA2_/TRDRNA2_36968_c0_seq1.p1 gnl/TRDRNA2_/TRDRNA2_36968_c0~~gnl/TRDRNA2_/TRDRNA2_36968_c0_seq1.p1  ORF type:complete len:740 (-),score=223.04 gnl/TRDRNA2_/TRDRNA2_36968_c0_seq1:22-2241(-)